MSLLEAADPLIGRTLGQFVLREQIGVGGFGTVYLADQPALHRQAVIKVPLLREVGDQAAVDRFLGEARLASSLDHPYAAHIYEFGAEPDGVLWIAMEFVDGTPLDAVLRQHGKLPLERFVPLLERICEVVQTAHDRGIVHRDLKPANVMVLFRAGRLLPKLLDFGIAKSMTAPSAPKRAVEGAPERLTLLGSPRYMAPEQWFKPESAGPACDIYALGILSYEVLTGQPPYVGDDLEAIARAHASGRPPALPPEFPAELNSVIAKAMAKRPPQRFANPLELAAAFRGASGLGVELESLPQLSEGLKENLLSEAPQPLAEAVANLEGAKTPRRAVEASGMVVHVLCRYLGLLSLAARARVGPGGLSDAPEVGALLALLRSHGLSDLQWLVLAAHLVVPFGSKREAHPLPELVQFFVGEEGLPAVTALEAVAALPPLAKTAPDTACLEYLKKAVPMLGAVLERMSFLLDYALVVQAEGPERWMGARRLERLPASLNSPAHRGDVLLVDAVGASVLSLLPLMQAIEPSAGAAAELFLLEGPGRHGAKLIAFPSPYERQDESLWLWLAQQGLLPVSVGETTTADKAPYKGLSTFSTDDADHYFGREREAEAFANRMRREAFLAVVGPSGTGKSSFILAGVLPLLPRSWTPVVLRPGASPLSALTARLEAEGLPTPQHGVEALISAVGPERTLVLVLDQFEELVTLCQDANARAAFATTLLAAARHPSGRVRVVVTLRDDFLIKVQQIPAFRDSLSNSLQLLATPAADDLLRVVTEPAKRVGYAFDDAELPKRMVDAVLEHSGALALLSFTASQLWELRDRHLRQMRVKTYDALGGVGGALAHHAEATLASLRDEERNLVREAFRHLVTAQGTRAVLWKQEALEVLGGGSLAQGVLDKLVTARLLVSSETADGHDSVEVIHEALIGAWPRLVEWRHEDAENMRMRDQIRAAARQWEEKARASGLLWRGDVLLECRLWRARYKGRLTALEEAFVSASLTEASRGLRRRRILIATAFTVLSVGVVMLLRLNANVEVQRTQAVANAERATKSLAQSHFDRGRQLVLSRDYLPGLVYLNEASKLERGGLSMEVLLAQATAPIEAQRLVLRGHTGQIICGAYSPNGKFVVTGADDGTARVWDTTDGHVIATLHHEKLLQGVAVSPDSTRVVTSSWDTTAKIWEVPSGRLIATLKHPDALVTVDYSHDGRTVVTSCNDGVARVWSAQTGELIAELKGHTKMVASGRFSPDDSRVATASEDGTVRLWNARTGAPVSVLTGHSAPVKDAIFSRDGSRLVTISYDRTARIWESKSGRLLTILQGHSDYVWGVAFSPDQKTIATVSQDGTARLWGLDGTLLHVLNGHRGNIFSVDWSSDSKRVVTTSGDSSAKVWSAETGTILSSLDGHSNAVLFGAFSPDSQEVLTVSGDGTARIWHPRTSALVASRAANLGDVTELSDGYSRNGPMTSLELCGEAHFVTTGNDRTAKLWEASTGKLVRVFAGHQDEVRGGACTVDGARVATASKDGTVRCWDTKTGDELWRRRIEGAGPQAVAFSSGGTLAAIARDGALRLYSPKGDELFQLEAPTDARQVTFSHDGARVLVRGGTTFVRVWEVASGTVLASLKDHEGPIVAALFSPDDRTIATVGIDRTVKLWNAATGKLDRSLTLKVWPMQAAFSPDGRRLVVTCADGVSVVFSIESGEQVGLLSRHQGETPLVRYSPDGRVILTGGDLTARLWDADTLDLLATYSGHRDTPLFGYFVDEGRKFVIGDAAGWAFVWAIERYTRSPAVLSELVRCNVPLALHGSTVTSVEIDPRCYAAQ